MTTKLQTYPKYKPSGVEWLGDVPEGWTLKRNRFLSSYKKGKTADICTSDEKDCLPYLSAEVIRGSKEPEFCRGAVVVKEEQILLLWDGANAGEFFWAGPGAVSSTFSLVLPYKKSVPKFYYWLLKGFERILRDYTQGMGIPHVSPWIFKDSVLPEVPIREQKQIADFLDKKTKVIDGLIEKKEKLIDLLREKRAALITRAVTKGLNPNVKLRPSGIDWLGDIPEGWELISLKKLLSYEQPGSYMAEIIDTSKHQENMVPVLTANKGFIIGYTDEKEGIFSKNLPVIIFDDFTTNKKFVDFPFKVRSSALKILKIRKAEENDIRFIFRSMEVMGFHVLEHNRHWIEIYSKENIAHPSLREQKQIADYLYAETSKTDKVVALIKSQIEKLKEYRSSLIYHAVTGKIKV